MRFCRLVFTCEVACPRGALPTSATCAARCCYKVKWAGYPLKLSLIFHKKMPIICFVGLLLRQVGRRHASSEVPVQVNVVKYKCCQSGDTRSEIAAHPNSYIVDNSHGCMHVQRCLRQVKT